MKHSALSMLLLFGIGLSPALGLLGGGNVYYGRENPAIQQSTGNTAETGTKATGDGIACQKTAENHGAESCTDTEKSACADPSIHLDK